MITLIDPDYFDLMAGPVRGEIYPSAVTAELDLFLDHLFAVNLEFDFCLFLPRDAVNIFGFFFVQHFKKPFS